MRKSTLLWLLLAAFCGSSLFYTTQRVHDGREKLSVLVGNIAKEEDTLRVLRAEWSYLNQPARLEKLSRRHLQLAPLKGRQFATVEDIPLHDGTPQASRAENLAIKINAPPQEKEAAAQQKPAARSFLSDAANNRSFLDVMKSLGVRQ